MLKFFFIITTMILVTFFLIMINIIAQKKIYFSMEKNSPYECGFSSFMISRIPFSNQFFIIGLIFLIFDVEITLILPLIPASIFSMNLFWLYSLIFFFFILILGLIIEWSENSLNWLT